MSRIFLDIIPECYIDTYLVAYLLRADRVNHQHSCNNVINAMKANKFSVGIVDYDKAKRDAYNHHWTLLAKGTEKKLRILFLKHHTEPHYLIAIDPAMEAFVLKCAEELNLNLSYYGLPANLDEFCHLTKSGKLTPKDIRFKRLFNDIRTHPSIETLQKVLQYLNDCRYQSSDNIIKKLIAEGLALNV